MWLVTEPTVADIGVPGRTVVMGVVNVTPDSFSDGGRFATAQQAIDYGIGLRAQGADIVDVGGESTRPGATRVSAEDESARVLPVIAGLTAAGVRVSIDTMRAVVAARAVEAGAGLVNDVSGGLADRDMLAAVASLQVPLVLMHWRSHSRRMDEFTCYDDVVDEVLGHLARRRDAALEAGVTRDRIILDPGLGFAKQSEHNWALLHDLPALIELGQPVLVAASRKRFLGSLLAEADREPRPIQGRSYATDAVSAIAAASGVWGVRVHDVPGTCDAVRVAQAWRQGGRQ